MFLRYVQKVVSAVKMQCWDVGEPESAVHLLDDGLSCEAQVDVKQCESPIFVLDSTSVSKQITSSVLRVLSEPHQCSISLYTFAFIGKSPT
jgi:hypothetical protein